ncbi:MAG: molybdopterin-dependent oxidoreductase [Proteobacteria bacterium]|nr:molybdopterin-dependent oxidoreductase [Pseudomonadota bacterium]MCP4917899.1 molybdopterin-dependent oxidoreductase [Pseudomonadota bacterium]
MSETHASYCRACEGMCGVHADVEAGRIAGLAGDPDNPMSAGHLCGVGRATAAVQRDFETPLKRVGDAFQPIGWDQALAEIGDRIGALRRSEGPRSVGLYAGGALAYDHPGVLRTAAFAFGMGTPNLFSELAMYGASKLYATELVCRTPMALQADVGRSHYTILIGGDQGAAHWGPMQAGTIHHQALDYFRKRRKGTKLVVVDSRESELSRDADSHVRLRPGTEVFYMLGLAHATLENRWIDEQYVADYTKNMEQARRWLEPWTPTRCAEICGIDVGDLAGVGLKYGRSAMSTVVPSPTLLQSRHGAVAAWAWLVHAALSANLLRPGGLYESGGLLDLHTIWGSLPVAGAPETSVRGFRSLLAQAPGTAMAEEILDASEPIKALITLSGCPLNELPGRQRVGQALDALELLVVVDHQDSPTAQKADYILPNTHFWQRADLHLLDHAILPSRFTQATDALVDAGDARDTSDILVSLFSAASPPLRGGAWGRHLKLLGRTVAGGDLDGWIDEALDWAGLPDRDALAANPLDDGETDRAEWRIGGEDELLDLAPEPLGEAVRRITAPTIGGDWPLFLTTAAAWPGGYGWRYRADDAVEPGIRVHPDSGLKEGEQVVLETANGSVEGPVHLDASVHPEGVLVPWGWAVPAGELVGTEDICPLSGSPEQAGLPCRIRGVGG